MKLFIKIIIAILLIVGFANAKKTEGQSKSPSEADINKSISEKLAKIVEVDEKLAKNIWLKRYNDYNMYNKLQDDFDSLKSRIQYLKKTDASDEEISDVQKKIDAVKKQMLIYGDTRNSVFGDLTRVDEIANPKRIDNPLLIFSAVSTIRGLDDKKNQYESRLDEIDKLLEQLKIKKTLLQDTENNITKIRGTQSDINKEELKVKLSDVSKEIVTITNERDDYEAAISIYQHKSAEVSQRLKFEAKEQLLKLLNIGVLILALFLISFLIKIGVKSYLKENHEKSYIVNKVIGITTYVLVFFTLLLSYIENVSYIVTILGFASAGIAIAMKDWFMSLLGWLAIVSSGMIKVGDRIRVNSSDSGDVLGDILDISPLKITIYEDVTMLSYDKHKRAGRVVFIPNNLIFSKLIFNYSHNGLKTVWDSITFALTYDSDLDKAMGIIREVVHKHTKGFTKHKEKQTQKLRADYNIRGYSFEPRILTFIESYGISVSTWYQTDSYRALSMKSVISKDIFDNLKNEPDIKFAYPTSSIMLSDSERRIESERVIGE